VFFNEDDKCGEGSLHSFAGASFNFHLIATPNPVA